MGLSELVQGYVKGQELKMKKVREVADKTAEEFSRQFKVQQAQTEAAQQEILNQQNAARIRLEQQAQTDREADKRTAADQKKRDADIREAHWKAVNDIAAKKMDLSSPEKLNKAIVDLTYKFETGGLGHEEAKVRALDTIQAGQSYGQGTGLPMPAQSQQQAQQQSVPAQTGNPIMDAIHGMQQQRGAGQPNVGPQVLPRVAAELALKQTLEKQAEASAERQKAIADLTRQDAALTKRMLEARVDLTKEQKKNLDSEIMHRKNMEPYQIAELQARTIEIQTHSQAEIRNADVSAMREQRLQIESDIKNDPTSGTAKNKLLANLDKARTAHLRLNEEIIKSVAHAASLSDKFAKAQKENDIATMKTAAGMQAAVANQLSELRNAHTEAYKNYISAQSAVKEFGLKEVTSPSGGVAHRANDADTRAVNSARRSADRIRPVPILPPGAPIVPRSQPGLYARPRTPDAPKKKIEKKKGKVVYDNGGITIREK